MNKNNELQSNSPDLLTKIGVVLSLLSITALTISYLNHLMFYSFFGIPINNYIQIGESVVLFLPQFVNYIINTIMVFSIWIAFAYAMEPIIGKTETEYNATYKRKKESRYGNFHDQFELLDFFRDIRLSTRLLKRSFLNKRIKPVFSLSFRIAIIAINFMSRLLIFLVGPALMLTPYNNNTNKASDSKIGIFTITILFALSVVSFDMIFGYSNYLLFKVKNKDLIQILKVVKIIFYAFLIVYIQSSVSASNIKDGQPEYDVEFSYNNKSVRTDTNTVYIGATQNYVFLYNRHNRKNMVYKTDKIENYIIKKVEYSNVWFWQ